MNLYKNYYGDAPVPWYKKAAIGLMEFCWQLTGLCL